MSLLYSASIVKSIFCIYFVSKKIKLVTRLSTTSDTTKADTAHIADKHEVMMQEKLNRYRQKSADKSIS
jgi:hypothetical protein